MTFFQGFPAPDFPTRPRTPKPVRPEWSGAHADELPAVVHLGQFLYRSPTRILAVRSAHVYSTGCLIDVSWLLRRGDETDQEWAMLHATFFGSRHVPIGASKGTELLFGVQFPDGSKASTGSIPSPYKPDDPTYRPDPPVLYLQNQGGGGGGDDLGGSGTLWLWPLPPARDLRLVAQWTDMGMPESSITLDGTRLRDAAPNAQKYWPEDTQG